MNQETNHTLYEITKDIEQLDQNLEIDNEDDRKAMIECVSLLLVTKIDSCVGYSQSLDDAVTLIDDRIEKLKRAKEVIQKKQSRFHEYIMFCLDRLGITEIKGKINRIKIRAASQRVEITDEKILPIEFVETKVTTVVKKNEVKNALKNGEIIPGAVLTFGERSLSFSINTK